MKIGISTNTFFNTTANENMFDIMRNMRVDTTEVCLNTFSEYEKQYVDKLSKLKNGVNVVAVSPLSTQFEPQLFSPSVRVRADAELIFKKVCYACFAFGAKFYTFRGPINFSRSKNFSFSHMAQRYAQLCDIASMYGVNLSIKNMCWSYAAKPDSLKKLLETCPRLFVTLDMFNAEGMGYDLREYLDVCAPQRINLIEVADFGKNGWCLPGRGKYNFERLFNELERRKITAPVLMSVRSDSYVDYVQVRDSFEWMCSVYNNTKS